MRKILTRGSDMILKSNIPKYRASTNISSGEVNPPKRTFHPSNGHKKPVHPYIGIKAARKMSETSASSWDLASCGVDIVYFSAAIEILL